MVMWAQRSRWARFVSARSLRNGFAGQRWTAGITGKLQALPNVRFPPIADISRSCDDRPVNAKPSDWLRLGLTLLLYAVATIALALMMNFTGDCGPDVQDCGETARKLSFVVLALGAAWLVYLVVRFVRDHKP